MNHQENRTLTGAKGSMDAVGAAERALQSFASRMHPLIMVGTLRLAMMGVF